MARAMTACTRVGNGHDERESLDRARRRTARTPPLRREPDGKADRGGPALDAATGPEHRRWKSSPTQQHRSQRTSWSGSSAPTHASAPASSAPPPACSPPTTPTRPGATATNPNFDPERFAASTDTIYITAPEHKQALCAPLIVGLLEQIRHATYQHAAERGQRPRLYSATRMLWALDEVANIAPIHDLPALVSQAGGQNLQVMIGLQDLSQASTRWGDAAADGFMCLFQTRLVLQRHRRQQDPGVDLSGDRRVRPRARLQLNRTQRENRRMVRPAQPKRQHQLPNPSPTHPHPRRNRPTPRQPRPPPARRRLGPDRAHALAPLRALDEHRKHMELNRINPNNLTTASGSRPQVRTRIQRGDGWPT